MAVGIESHEVTLCTSNPLAAETPAICIPRERMHILIGYNIFRVRRDDKNAIVSKSINEN